MLERLIVNIQAYPLDYVGHILILLPVVVGIYRRQFLNKGLKLVVLYFFASFLEECVQLYYLLKVWNNIHLYNIYLIVDVFLIGVVYHSIFDTKRSKLYIKLAIIISVFVCFFTYKYNEFSSIGNTVFRVYCTVLVLAYFNWLLIQMKVANILLHSFFWISAGLLLYSLGTLFMYLFSQYTISSHISSTIFDLYWRVKQILYMLFCVFSSVGVWVSKYEKENYI